ncbi:MAG: flagellar basal-body MS-ring/collar protein FliF [Pseudomonadota bacterium]
MNQVAMLWNGLDGRRRLLTGAAALAAALMVLFLARTAATPAKALLFAGLEPSAAGQVISELDARQIPYEVRGDAIFVPEGRRDALRLSLAGGGLPGNGASGYEVLDGLSGFGTTAEMFDAAYWRAKEGELARTILALPQVRQVRVHIANPRRRPFERGAEPSASVAVSAGAAALSAEHARAIRHLVAASVAGLAPSAVTVVDADNGLAIADPLNEDMAADGADRAEQLKTQVERLLAARVGPDSVIVEVSVDADMNSETVRERVLDPAGRVAIHSDTSESTERSEGGEGAAVTVASNLPDGDAAEGGGSVRDLAETRERVNYEVSEVLTERVRRPGEIRRITVAVMVDGLREPGAAGDWRPRPQEELDALRALVESAVGFDAGRGDVITIQSLEFTRPPELGTSVGSGAAGFFERNAMSLVQLGVLSAVALAIAFFVLRPMLLRPAPEAAPALPSAELESDGDVPGEVIDGAAEEVELALAAAEEVVDAGGAELRRLEHLRGLVAERPEDAAGLLAIWLDRVDEQKEAA